MSRVLVVTEQNGGVLHKMSLETLAAGQSLGEELTVAVMGSGAEAAAQALAGFKASKVVVMDHPALGVYTASASVAALAWLIAVEKPDVVLLPHTYQTRDFAPRLAARLGRPLVSDAVSVGLDEKGLIVERQLFQGKMAGTFRCDSSGPAIVTIQAGAYRADQAEAGTAPVSIVTPELGELGPSAVPGEPYRESARTVDLSAAERIVAAGRGIKEEGNLEIVKELAEALGAELAASRPICDNGWLGMERQVGSSGQTVAPKLYVAVGISGAIQHIVGMKGSKCIVAINRDPEAPIFESADYGIVGDLFDVVPAIVKELKG
ncbi:MAG: electron transfer flavoprotein subunit alpha/FixB family protein [Bryobacteraceae bacterium]|nr:electron transfer flavoprotein subunit alpha/FixB family protein [Bryobacteraceae bacterium]